MCIWIYPVPFQSAQRLIESLDSLEYIGPMEMFTKLSKVRKNPDNIVKLCQVDVLDLVSWVREHNWAIVIGYRKAFFI